MVKLVRAKPSLAEICRSRGVTLAELAKASGVRLPSIKQLEQNPPRKRNTWRLWQKRILMWVPLLGHTFQYALETRAFDTCPPDIMEAMLVEYQLHESELDNQQLQAPSELWIREAEFIVRAQELAVHSKWAEAKTWFERAARLFPRHDSRWAFHYLTMAQLDVDMGELESAEKLIRVTLSEYQSALHTRGKQIDPQCLALAEATWAWSSFLRGESVEAKQGFDQTIRLARVCHNIDLIHRGLHMGARALAEPYILHTYFANEKSVMRLSPTIVKQGIDGIDAALAYDIPGSPTEAFGLWYKGILIGLSGDTTVGLRLIAHAEKQLKMAGLFNAAMTHAGLSHVHFSILSAAWDAATLRQCENKLRDIVSCFTMEKYPYAFSDTLVTLAYCRIQKNDTISLPVVRNEIADLLCLALLAHPHPKSALWQSGKHLLFNRVFSTFSKKESDAYIYQLRQRVLEGNTPFEHLIGWQINIGGLDILEKELKLFQLSS